MSRLTGAVCAIAVVQLLCTSATTSAYSVLAHEAIIDSQWTDQLAPLLKQKFPGLSTDALRQARAYAYGGSLIQDLGYYPFGSHFFSNLVHYVRSGDFVESLLQNAHDANEYAFALGALAHYVSDTVGHPGAVNRVVPILYPKLRTKYGPEVLYADSPARHIMVEFAFDVVEVGRGAFKSDAYQELVGFKVATPLLERAFRDTYGLELREVFGDTELAINTYRRAASQLVPDVTRLAWKEKRDDIMKATPGIVENDFVYSMSRKEYEKAYGTKYRKPSLFARFIVTIFKIVPKFGPFKPLAFTPLTPDTEEMFVKSFEASQTRYGRLLAMLRSGRVTLGETDLDTGKRPIRGTNSLADKTYADLLETFAKQKFVGVSVALRRDINAHYASGEMRVDTDHKLRKQEQKAARNLAALNAAATN